jgi:thioredoxin
MAIVACPMCGAKNRIDENRVKMMQSPVRAKCGKCGTPLSATASDGHPIEVSDATFQSTLASAGDKPVLVDCWAAWCGPCKMIAPTIDQLASESGGKWLVTKLDVDRNPQTATQFQISSIPSLLIFKNGKLVDKLVGLQPKPAIEQRLARAAAS